jgi:hypothetical protein
VEGEAEHAGEGVDHLAHVAGEDRGGDAERAQVGQQLRAAFGQLRARDGLALVTAEDHLRPVARRLVRPFQGLQCL